MKKNLLRLFAFALLFGACKHEPIAPDTEYLNQAVYDKISEYADSYLTGVHDVFSIYFQKDTTGKENLVVFAHISYNHTLDAIKVNQNNWLTLPQHSGSSELKTDLSSAVDNNISFQIRSKTPQNEVTNGEVLVPKSTPMTATDLGNNTFRINWTPQYRKQKVLIYLTYYRVYVQRLNNAYAVETEDDGELILKPSVFEQFKPTNSQLLNNATSEGVTVGLLRINPKRRTVVKQPSTGTEYAVYGGNASSVSIEVQVK